MATPPSPPCPSSLPSAASRWNLSWPGATPTTTPSSTPTRTPTNAPGSTATPTPTGSHGVDPHWGPEHQATFSTHIASGVVGRNLAVDAANRLHIMWGEINGTVYDALYSRSTDGGVTWSSPLDVANSTFPATGPNLVIGPDGALHSMWHDRRSGGAGASAKSLSGGNLQKFIIGREISSSPKLLIVSQPPWGVDVGPAAQIRGELLQTREQGCAALVGASLIPI